MSKNRREPSEDVIVTVKDLAVVLRDWLVETINQELEASRSREERREENLDAMLQPSDATTKQVRARRFREALAGLETMLLGQQEIEYRPVLDHIVHNIGASLQGLGLLAPEGGLVDAPKFDFRKHATFPAMVAPRRYIALPRLTRAMETMGFSRYWSPGATAYLTEYRAWQPRFLRGPAHDEVRFGLFVWNNLYQKDLCFLPLSRVPGCHPTGLNELVMLGQRTSLLGRLFDASPHYEEHIARLAARDFTYLLRALLLDYEALHTLRQREVAEQDQLGAMLWDFLSREE